jgi:membrane protein required for colicin V production
MPITLLDGILVGFTLVSAMLAMVRGFSREILSIASWAAAAAAAYFFYPQVLPYVEPYVDHKQIAMAAAAGIVFVIALIVVTVITMKIADFIIDSRVGALDRTLGFLYGAARGILVVAVGLLFFNWLVGVNPPSWIAEAKSRPLLEDIGGRLQALLPDDPENSILKKLTPETAEPAPETGGETPPATGDAPPAEGNSN